MKASTPGLRNASRSGRGSNMGSSDERKMQLLAGVKVLDRVLAPSGFFFQLEAHAKGSGGWFASGCYRRGDRTLELHYRHSLGLVTYHIGRESLDHETYMRFVGAFGRNHYPDFPKKPLESFKHLADDITEYCSDFVSGDGSSFLSWAMRFKKNPNMLRLLRNS